MCQLVGRCDDHWGDIRRFGGCMIVVRKCGSSTGGVSSIRKGCQLMERCDRHGGCKGVWEGVITSRRCDGHQVGLEDVRKVCQLSGSVSVLQEVCQVLERGVS